eukprot:3657505-Ditylum_brightwellii.AAC.1
MIEQTSTPQLEEPLQQHPQLPLAQFSIIRQDSNDSPELNLPRGGESGETNQQEGAQLQATYQGQPDPTLMAILQQN